MAVIQYYLDKRVLKANKDSTLGIKNLLDLNAFILSVVEDSTSEFTSINVDALVEKTAAHGVDVDGALIKDGGITANSMIAGFYPSVATNNITAGTGGAILVTNYFTTINTDAGGDAFTLANGTQIGQLKLIRLVADGGGNGVVTPTSLSGGTTITFDDAADEVELIWNGTAWVVIKNLGATVA